MNTVRNINDEIKDFLYTLSYIFTNSSLITVHTKLKSNDYARVLAAAFCWA